MPPSSLSIIFIIGLLCLPPLALYLNWLGVLNRRRHLTILSGSFDFVIMMAGLSGFLIFGSALILAALQSNARYAFFGDWDQLETARQREQLAWFAIVIGYLLIVSGGIVLAMLARRPTLSIYNCVRSNAETLVDASLRELGMNPTRFGNTLSHNQKLLEIEPFGAFRHVTVRIIVEDQQLAQEIERSLRKNGNAFPVPISPLAGWFQLTALLLLTFILASLFLLLYLLKLIFWG